MTDTAGEGDRDLLRRWQVFTKYFGAPNYHVWHCHSHEWKCLTFALVLMKLIFGCVLTSLYLKCNVEAWWSGTAWLLALLWKPKAPFRPGVSDPITNGQLTQVHMWMQPRCIEDTFENWSLRPHSELVWDACISYSDSNGTTFFQLCECKWVCQCRVIKCLGRTTTYLHGIWHANFVKCETYGTKMIWVSDPNSGRYGRTNIATLAL